MGICAAVSCTNFFSLPTNPGLADMLDGQLDWNKALQPTFSPNLTLIQRGTFARHPGELFTAPAMGKFLKEAAGHYEYILFDTPPVMAADDVSNLAPFVDGVVMVIRSGYTSGRVARAALDLLHLRKMKIIGLVLNAVRVNSSEQYYYKYKEYYTTSSKA